MTWTLCVTCRVPDDETFDVLVAELCAVLDRHGIEDRGIVFDRERALELVPPEDAA